MTTPRPRATLSATVEPEGSELSRSSRKRLEELLALLRQIQAGPDPTSTLLLQFQRRYRELPWQERTPFFEALLQMEVPRQAIEQELRRVLAEGQQASIDWCRRMTQLRRAIESPRMAAFRRLPNSTGGFKFLLDLRADVLAAQRRQHVDLEPLDEEIAHLLDSWFQHGFLFLQEITLDSPLRQIQFLREHELVHPMESLEEMQRRLGEDSACFALYHRALPEEPVVFIEAALTRGLCRSIHDILERDGSPPRPQADPDTAIFYSISNTQHGLSGLGLGGVLVFQVVEAIRKRNPAVKRFATLSPIPGFWRRYLRPLLRGEDERFLLKRSRLQEFFVLETGRQTVLERHAALTGRQAPDFPTALLEVLDSEGWLEDAALAKALRRPLTRLTYFYLTREKNLQGGPLNPVAGFHLGNGATLGANNVNFGANRSRRGLEDSCGMMVNYVYSPSWLQNIGRTIRALLPWRA